MLIANLISEFYLNVLKIPKKIKIFGNSFWLVQLFHKWRNFSKFWDQIRNQHEKLSQETYYFHIFEELENWPKISLLDSQAPGSPSKDD